MSDDPSPPVTLSATMTADGMVIVCATEPYVISKIILPTVAAAGQFVKDSVIEALDVIVW